MSSAEVLQSFVSRKVHKNKRFSSFSSMHVGGHVDALVQTETEKELIDVVCFLVKENIRHYIFGGGSNMLVPDDGFSGVMIQVLQDDIRIEHERVYAHAGAVTAILSSKVAAAGLTGFEWAIGIPGRLGGAIYGNSGAMGGEMKDVVRSVDVLDHATLERKTLSPQECAFGYRESGFKTSRDIILGAWLQLTPGNPQVSQEKMKEFLRYRNSTQPKGFASCGCMFKNYEPTEAECDMLRTKGVPESMLTKHRVGAGWLIEHAGAKSLKEGAVQVSDIHGNFVVNAGHGTASDVRALIDKVRARVYERFGVHLEQEVQMVK